MGAEVNPETRSALPFSTPAGSVERVDRPLARASTLPGPFFQDPVLYAQEIRELFLPAWQCIGREDEWTGPGAYRTYEVAGSGFFVLQDGDGKLRAFHNVCRHRGTRLLEAPEGEGLNRIQCPYHAWTYGLDGRLLGAPHMSEAKEFDRNEFGLYPVTLETWRSFVFVKLQPGRLSLADFLGGFVRRAASYPLERLRRAVRVTYDIQANWKLVAQNANECYHCPGVHPQLVRLTPYTSGGEDEQKGPLFGGWMDFVDGVTTLTPSGTSQRPIFGGLSAEDLRRVYYYILYPTNFFSLLPDYLTVDWIVPDGPERTKLVFDLYVDRDAPDDAADAMEFWETTNRQDWHICELAHKGSRTVAYRQGRYSSEEELVHAIDRYYVRRTGMVRPTTDSPE